MKHGVFVLSVAMALSLGACKKEDAESAGNGAGATPDATTATTERAPSAGTAAEPAADPAAEPSEEQRARAEQQAKLDYATMEDGYINDAKGQWAASAKASSSFGKANDEPADSQRSNTPWQATGTPNGEAWNNNNQDIGFDWIELAYANPVKATEVRAVTTSNEAAESISKIELIDTDGAAHAIWSGLSETKRDARGARTWVVHKFDATPYQVKSVKLTFANNVANGYKQVDAVQLIGE